MYKLKSLSLILATAVMFMVGCTDHGTLKHESRMDVIILDSGVTEVDNLDSYNALCIVGKVYIIYSIKEPNPFVPQEYHSVYLRAKRDDWVEYVYDYDSANNNAATFHRTCKEFIESTRKPKNK